MPVKLRFVVVFFLLLLGTQAMAQGFGGPRPPVADGFTGWIIARQSEFYLALSRAIKDNQGLGLIWLSFLYGIFHAAGPGHGKAVISGYIVATDESYRRGLMLSALSSLVQALSALVIVGVLTLLFQATAQTMKHTVFWIEWVAFSLMALMGLWLMVRKGRAFWRLLTAYLRNEPLAAGCDDGCSHPDMTVQRPRNWRETASLVLSTGLRPCSGALIVLVFALSQQRGDLGVASVFAMAFGTMLTIFALASIAKFMKQLAVRLASNRPGLGMVMMGLIELLAAAVIMIFGLLLLTGSLVSERTMPF